MGREGWGWGGGGEGREGCREGRTIRDSCGMSCTFYNSLPCLVPECSVFIFHVYILYVSREKEEDLEKRQFFLNRELRPLMEIPGNKAKPCIPKCSFSTNPPLK